MTTSSRQYTIPLGTLAVLASACATAPGTGTAALPAPAPAVTLPHEPAGTAPDTIGEGARVIPSAPNTRTVDQATAAGDALQEFIREHGRGPSADELAELYSGLGIDS